jgi:serine protease Do
MTATCPAPHRARIRAMARRSLRGLLVAQAVWSLHAPAGAAGLVDVVAATKPSVVAIGSYNPTASPRFGFHGTGFVVGNGNQVITNRHVLPGADEVGSGNRLAVAVPRGNEQLPDLRPATVAATDPEHDLALLTIEGPALPALAVPAGDLPREGLEVALIGFPLGAGLGLAPVTHRGIIAAITSIALPAPTSRQLDNRTAARLRQGPFRILQLDATAYPGNSGSPLVDAATGELIGVINLVLTKATKESAISTPTGITYAVPAMHVRELLQPGSR